MLYRLELLNCWFNCQIWNIVLVGEAAWRFVQVEANPRTFQLAHSAGQSTILDAGADHDVSTVFQNAHLLPKRHLWNI